MPLQRAGTRVLHPRHSVACLGIVLSLAGCTREPAAAPPNLPEMSAPLPSAPEQSRLSVPLEYDFTPLLAQVERIVPKTFGSMDSVHAMKDDDRKHYAFAATRGPFTAFADGNRLHLRATWEYTARGYYKPPLAPTISAGCGKGSERPRLVVELATPLTINASWHLVSHAQVVKVDAASTEQRDHCDVSFLHRDVTPSVVEAARAGLTSQLPAIDRKIGTVNLSEKVGEWWGLLARPIRLRDDVWLLLGPEKLRLGSVRGRSKILTVPVSLDARPRVLTGSEPAVVTPPLPPLGRDTAGAEGFHVVMDGMVDYGTASRELTSAFDAKTITESGHTVMLHQVSILPQPKGQLGLSVDFTGDATGTLKLIGTPKLDHLHNEITVPDLDFDLRSNSKLLKSYAWLKSDALRKELRHRARIGTGPVLERGRALLLEGLNRKLGDAVTLSGTVDSVAMRSLFVTRDGLVVRAEASGAAGMSVRQQ